MFLPRTPWLSLGITIVVAFALWAGLGSQWMSRPMFGWVTAVLIGIVAVTLMSLKAGRPTRSVAHVLHDAEEQKGVGR